MKNPLCPYKPLKNSNGTFESSMGRISPTICNDTPSGCSISNDSAGGSIIYSNNSARGSIVLPNLRRYKNMFGEPNKGWRKKYRFLDISYVDVLVVVLFCGIISWFSEYPLIFVLVVVFFLGIIAHRIFYVRTRVDRWLFPEG